MAALTPFGIQIPREKRRILLTGAGGFLGKNVIAQLLQESEVTIGALVHSGSRRLCVPEIEPVGQLVSLAADLNDKQQTQAVVQQFFPDTVVHLAWWGVLSKFRNDSRQMVNLHMTVNLLEICQQLGVRHWIGLGSQAELGPQTGPVDESALPGPTSLYGVIKLATNFYTANLCGLAGIRFAWLRLFSTFGPGDDCHCMIPYVILSLLRGRRPAVTEGRQKWDYLFVEDVAQAISLVSLLPTAQGIFNLGSGEVLSIREVIEKIRDLINPSLPVGFGEIPYARDQVMHLQARSERLRQATGWSPHISLEQGLLQTIAWYREHEDLYL